MQNPHGEYQLPGLTSAIGDQVIRFIAQYSPQLGISREDGVLRNHKRFCVNPFLAAQLGHTVLAAQAHDPDLVLGREVPPGRPALYRVPPSPPLTTAYRFSISSPAPSAVKDEPEILSSSIVRNCPTCADGEHGEGTRSCGIKKRMRARAQAGTKAYLSTAEMIRR